MNSSPFYLSDTCLVACCQMFHYQHKLLWILRSDSQRERSLFFHLSPPPVPWGHHLFLLIEECDRYVFLLLRAFNKRKEGGPVLLERFHVYFSLLRLRCVRLSDSNCDWTLTFSGVRSWKKFLILSFRETPELTARRNGILTPWCVNPTSPFLLPLPNSGSSSICTSGSFRGCGEVSSSEGSLGTWLRDGLSTPVPFAPSVAPMEGDFTSLSALTQPHLPLIPERTAHVPLTGYSVCGL